MEAPVHDDPSVLDPESAFRVDPVEGSPDLVQIGMDLGCGMVPKDREGGDRVVAPAARPAPGHLSFCFLRPDHAAPTASATTSKITAVTAISHGMNDTPSSL